MDSPPKLSGETLIVHHIPLVHCQIPDRQCCGSVKRASTFCQSDLGLTRTTSLPEQDVQQKEALVYSSLIQTSSGSGRGSFVSDSSSFSSSNNSEEPSSQSKSRDPVAKANQQRHNPFLLNSEEEVEDNSLDGYLEDSSFHLHGNSNTHTGKQSSFHLHDLTFAPEPFLLHNGVGVAHKTWNCVAGRPVIAEGQGVGETNHAANNVTAVSKNAERPSECLDIMGYDCQRRHGSSGSTLSMDCGEQEWNASPPDDEDQLRNGQRSRACSCCSSSDFPLASSSQRCHCCFYSFSDPSEMTDQQMGYISDSSCNSSDGVLVNFSAIYNKMNNGGPSKPLNLNSGDQSCASSVCSHLEAGGAFYLDLHTSPTEPREDSCQEQGSKTCSCHHKHQQQQQSPQGLDANCNSYHLHCGGGPCLSEGSDLTSCFQSQARLVVATQNYYKLVTCDLSSQSSPSPAGSSITSCSEEHTKSSPSQPTEYYLFQKPEDNQEVMKEEQPEKEVEEEEHTQGSEMSRNVIEGQVYVNVSPPNMSSGRPRSRSYDRNLDKSPSSRLGTLERMLSCPVKLSESASHCSSSHRSSPPRRVTSFAEIARSKKKSSSVGGGSPPLRTSTDSSSLEFSPVGELQLPRHTGESHSLPPMPFVRCYSQGSCDLITSSGGGNPLQQGPPRPLCDSPRSARETRAKAEGQSVKQLQNYYSDFFPDYFSLAEKPPDEFCLSPDATTESISIDLLQKKCLVKAINTAVDLIVAHFGTSRDPGVKAKLGNSSVSPNVGHLILKYLCPALREVLLDGLKAYVLDMIIGQRRNMPWSLVEASTQLGPSTKVLHGLHSKISQYSELTNHSMRFNAFVFGLLNIRSLEFWFNHLYTHEDIVAAHYHPWGFLPLSQGVCQPLFEELLLLLQPLSLLPFDLDLLFEHRLLQKGHEQLRRKEQLCSAGQGLEQSVRSTFQLMRGWGVGSAREGAPESRREGAGSERAELKDTEASPSRTERERRKGFTATGEESLRDPGASCKGEGQPKAAGERPKAAGRESWWEREEGERERRKENETEQQQMPEGVRQKDRQAGWWYQLMQSSQVYIENSNGGSKFIKWEKRRKPAGEANGSHHQGCNTRLGGGGGGAALDTGGRQARPPLREGVVEGAEAVLEARRELSSEEKGKPSWMGSPPESVLHELNQSKNKESEKQAGEKNAPQGQDSPEGLQGLRWGRLFGAGVGSPVKTQRTEQQPARTQKSRLPSGWLSLDKSVLDLMAQTMGAGKRKDTPPLEHASPPVGEQGPEQQQEAQVPKQQAPCREVRALCHHIATEPGQLSFNKGDVLRVLGRAEPEWLHCMLGELSGLVPIIYVTQPEKDSN
ncbi:AP-4 complex accessory subunit RUSC2-like isoform X4 [Acipenser ruthenus]|uniref:AP-4 complex accessory subunit RUSC2-like isoform X4 n=1 Tax=Acipenser ruthenus TaxID=7906 RepID=UPI002740A3F1|nr:AP-4 complex accessory subunit RUSC2-like isoform X4 [Acipenser ruthenus]